MIRHLVSGPSRQSKRIRLFKLRKFAPNQSIAVWNAELFTISTLIAGSRFTGGQ